MLLVPARADEMSGMLYLAVPNTILHEVDAWSPLLPPRVAADRRRQQRQRNAFGSSTGYAEQLKAEGMVKYNQYGEDMLQARRQQLENWQQQRALKAEQNQGLQELADLTGVEYDPRFGSKNYFDVLSKDKSEMSDDGKFTITQGEARKEAAVEEKLLLEVGRELFGEDLPRVHAILEGGGEEGAIYGALAE